MGKEKSARLGAVIYIAVTAGALAITMSFGWCGSESYTRRDLLTGLDVPRSTPCGVIRFFSAGLLDWVPC